MLRKIVCNIFLSCFSCNERVFKMFWSRIQKYRILIMRDRCCLILSLETTQDLVLHMHTCVMVYGWPIYYNMFNKMIKSLPITKHPLVSASAEEAPINFKMLQFAYIGPFRRSCAHFEGTLPEKKIMKHDYVLLVQSYMTHRCWHVK